MAYRVIADGGGGGYAVHCSFIRGSVRYMVQRKELRVLREYLETYLARR